MYAPLTGSTHTIINGTKTRTHTPYVYDLTSHHWSAGRAVDANQKTHTHNMFCWYVHTLYRRGRHSITYKTGTWGSSNNIPACRPCIREQKRVCCRWETRRLARRRKKPSAVP